MIDALIKRVSVTYTCYEMYAHRGKKVQLLVFWDHQEMDAILLIIGIVYGVWQVWFSPGTPVSSTNKTDRHDIAEILLKVVLNTINLNLI
jgi:hypothetical protein